MSGIPRGRDTAGLTRGGLGMLSLSALAVGLWALFLPRSFYADFPFPGRGWVSALGPYNGHLVVDVGAMYLALGVLLMAAAVSLVGDLVRVSLVAWLVFAVPHFVYHAATLHHYPLLVDKVGNVVSLGFVVLLPLILLFLAGSRRASEKRVDEGIQRRYRMAKKNATRARDVPDSRGSRPDSSGARKPTSPVFESLAREKYVLLTTFKRDGAGVGTPVHVAAEGGRAYLRTWDTTCKLKRIRNNPEVEVAPSTFRGRPTGPGFRAQARILAGAESARAGALLSRKYPILHGFLIPQVHRLRGNETVHVELTAHRDG